jgi:ribosomal protein S18 acetylase RimI-like enzyme
MASMELWLRPATADEIEDWLPALAADYAGEIAASGSLPPDQARQKAYNDLRKQLKDGLDTAGQLIFRLMAEEQPVGWLWLAVPCPGGDPNMAWVNDVEVDREFRGRGYGRQAMLLAEQEAGARGMNSVGLNVHGSNAPARALYDSLGYQVTTQQMKKALEQAR